MRTLAAARVLALHRLRTRFDAAAAAEKSALLVACVGGALTKPPVVLRYHETLLFMAAHPESRGQAAMVDAELARIESSAPALFRRRDDAEALIGSGLAGERIEAEFSIAMIEWLLAKYPDDVGLSWEDGEAGAALGDLLALGVLPVERDARIHPRFDMRRWLRFTTGAGANDAADLRWVIDRISALVPDLELRDFVTERVELGVRWRLVPGGATRTRTRFPGRRAFLQRGPLKRTFDIARLLRRPPPAPAPLTHSGARGLIDVARAVLAVRGREADPVTYANPREVALFALDRGIDIATFGLEPTRRLPLESYFGYVAARNGVPVAYGGGWVMDHRAEIGVHLFDTFRGGESAYLFGQVLRTYRHRFDVTRFQVDPYQFGDGNPDAIRSGAFWFYYRFGFRPQDATLRELAAGEWRRIRNDRDHRTPAAILRRFTKSPVVLDLGPRGVAPHRPDPTRIGIAVTEATRKRFGDDRNAAREWAIRRATRLLPARDRKRWSDDERRAFEGLCPLAAMLPGVDAWPAADRRALAALMRAKGGARERDYVTRVQRHRRLRTALAELEASVDWAAVPAVPGWRPQGAPDRTLG